MVGTIALAAVAGAAALIGLPAIFYAVARFVAAFREE